LLDKRRCLLVVDDVWRSDDLAPFFKFQNTRLLVTSRIQNLLSVTGWAEIPIDQMHDEEAAAVLGRGLSIDAASRLALIDLAQQLGCWPLLLGLANARLLEEQKSRHDVGKSIAKVFDIYLRKGVLGFDRRDSTARNTAVARSVEVGLEHAESMYPGLAALASELGIFPEDVAVPVRVLADLWGMDEFDTREDVVRPLDNVCLLEWDRERDEVSLHDIIRRVLESRLADATGSHERLVDAWGDPLQLPHDYAWRRLTFHLARSRRATRLRILLCDFVWLRAKLEATDITALVADFETFVPDDPLWLVQGALLLSSAYLAADKAQLASQLIGASRPACTTKSITARRAPTLGAARSGFDRCSPHSMLRAAADPRLSRLCRRRRTPRHRALDRDGLGGLPGCVGRQLQQRSVLIVWNLATGTHYKLEGQAEAGGWTPLAMSGGGDIFVSAHPGEVRAWRVGEPTPFGTCQVPGTTRALVAISDDATRIVIGESDGEIAVWNPSTGVIKALGRHGQAVTDIAVTPDGARAASINGVDARLWDLESGSELHRWPSAEFSRGNWSRGVSIADDGRRVTWSSVTSGGATGALWTWDAATGIPKLAVEVPEGNLFAFNLERRRAIMGRRPKDGRNEDSIALFVFCDQPRIIDMTDIGRGISCAAVSRDGRWATTADYEHDVMFWDLDRALQAPAGAVASLPPWRALPFHSFAEDGRYALFSAAGSSPFVWDIDKAAPAPVAELTGAMMTSAPRVDGAEAAFDRLDGKIRTKGSVRGEPGERGHTAPIQHCDVAPNLRWEATASEDGTVRIWDVGAQKLLAVFSDATIFKECFWASDNATLAAIDRRGKTHLLRLEGIKR
jgi:WD40 repeat protein